MATPKERAEAAWEKSAAWAHASRALEAAALSDGIDNWQAAFALKYANMAVEFAELGDEVGASQAADKAEEYSAIADEQESRG